MIHGALSAADKEPEAIPLFVFPHLEIMTSKMDKVTQSPHVRGDTCWTVCHRTHTHTQGVRKQVSVPLIWSEPCGDSAENQPVECVVCMPEIVPGESRTRSGHSTESVGELFALSLNGRTSLTCFWDGLYSPLKRRSSSGWKQQQ